MKQHFLTLIFTKMRPKLLSGARSILTGSDADAEDALQDAFCRLWSRRDELADESHAAGMTIVAVRNAAIDSLRRRKPTADLSHLELATAAFEPDPPDELYEEVDSIIRQKLTVRDREILYMRDRNGYDIESIAEAMETTEANVRVILSRARRTVRECYRQRINVKPQSKSKQQ